MTPKEKAEYLVNEFENETYSIIKDELAIKCALICVQEIIEATADDSTHNDFWLEVRKEIKKL